MSAAPRREAAPTLICVREGGTRRGEGRADVCVCASLVRPSRSAGLPKPQMSAAERASSSARMVAVLASMVGISIGCVLGLAPLLAMEDEDTRALRRTFNAIDADGTGVISFSELESALHQIGVSFSRATLHEIFDEIDSNRDHKLTFEEFVKVSQDWQLRFANQE